VLEVGPGTGQATIPILKTGCAFTAIELSDVFSTMLKEQNKAYPQVTVVNANFENHPFPDNHFDLVFRPLLFNGFRNKSVTLKRTPF